jgi:hypothetical protein
VPERNALAMVEKARQKNEEDVVTPKSSDFRFRPKSDYLIFFYFSDYLAIRIVLFWAFAILTTT